MTEQLITLENGELPFLNQPLRLSFQSESTAPAAQRREDNTHIIMITSRKAGDELHAEMDLSFQGIETVLLPNLSFPSSWISGKELAFSAESLVFSGPVSSPCLRIDPPKNTRFTLFRRENGFHLKISVQQAGNGPIMFCLTPIQDPLGIAPILPFGKNIPDKQTAAAFLPILPLLDRLETADSQALLFDHQRILTNLKKQWNYFYNYGNPKELEFLEAASINPCCGYKAVWPEGALVFLCGPTGELSFPNETKRMDIIGTGTITLFFKEDSKGLSITTYDLYGRPLDLWAGKFPSPATFAVGTGERMMLSET